MVIAGSREDGHCLGESASNNVSAVVRVKQMFRREFFYGGGIWGSEGLSIVILTIRVGSQRKSKRRSWRVTMRYAV